MSMVKLNNYQFFTKICQKNCLNENMRRGTLYGEDFNLPNLYGTRILSYMIISQWLSQ